MSGQQPSRPLVFEPTRQDAAFHYREAELLLKVVEKGGEMNGWSSFTDAQRTRLAAAQLHADLARSALLFDNEDP